MTIFRDIKPEDYAQLEQWIFAEPAHRHLTPDFWMEPLTPTTLCCAIDDDKGTVLYLKQVVDGQDIRLFAQFAPVTERRRIARVIPDVIKALRSIARSKGFRSMIFDTENPQLGKFVTRFGFRHEYRCPLAGE